MKLTLFFILGFIFQASASGFAQQVTLKKNGISLKVLFREIKRQTGYDIIYADKVLDDKRILDASFQNTPLNTVLTRAVGSQPVSFVIEGNSIVLTRKVSVVTEKKVVADITLTGKVVDENGKPMVGVTIKIATSASNSPRSASAQLLYTTSTISKSDGSFTITADPSSEYIVLSYVGYEHKVVRIGDQRTFSINMVVSKSPLDEVQVIAYGTTTRRLTTGSVTTLRQEDIAKQPVSNPLQVLEGRMPGAYITEAAGIAGGGINLQIRGTNSISSGKTPLYIVDGVPFSATPTEQSAGSITVSTPILGGTGTFTPFDNIPTSDIESIDILKDADATAIYGSRAANGVVVITTKKGKAGMMKVGANIYSGISKITREIDLLNTEQYLALRRQAFANDNITPTATNALDLTLGEGNTNFLKTMMGNTSHFTDGTVSVSGGTRQTQYLVSGNYRYQSTVLPGDFADKKGTLHFSIQSQSENNKFSISLSGSYTKNANNLPATNITSFYSLPPNLPLYNADGTFYWVPNATYTNPIAALQGPKSVKTDNVIANSTLKYNILPGLSFKTDIGFNRINFNAISANTRASRNPYTTTTGSVVLQENYNQVYTIEPQLNYTKQLGPGRLDALLGSTYQYNEFQQPYMILGTFTNDALYHDLGSTTVTSSTSGSSYSKFASLFGRLNYSMLGKYILSFNGRRDGSSRFGSDKKFGNFGSIGAAWIFSEENFLKNNLQWLSLGKLRGSYGTLGNDQIGDYAYLSTYASSGLATTYNGVATLVPSNLSNQKYAWEITKKLEFATDLAFINDRIMLTAAWYRNRSDNLLVYTPLASQAGFTGYIGNLPAIVENKGWEFSVDAKIVQSKNFTWSSAFNITIPKNKLIDFPGLASSGSYASTYVIGKSLSVVQAYHFTGFTNGIAQFEDLDKSGTISSGAFTVTGKGDYAIVGNTDPTFYGGINNSFKYKGFQLDFLFQFVKKDGYNIYNSSAIPGSSTNVIADVLKQPFQYTTLTTSAAGAAFTRYKTSDATFGDASFIRLKNISLNYNFSSDLTRKMGLQKLQSLNVYARAQNLLTFTKYLGLDPETMGTAIPPSKLISVGLQISF